MASAVLSYVDGSAKTVTADGTGAYKITLPYNWSGTITPSKTGYLFSPKSATFTNATAAQIIQNFAAIPAYTISGNAGVAGATLSYTDGTPKTVISDSSGNYSIVGARRLEWYGYTIQHRLQLLADQPDLFQLSCKSNGTELHCCLSLLHHLWQCRDGRCDFELTPMGIPGLSHRQQMEATRLKFLRAGAGQ